MPKPWLENTNTGWETQMTHISVHLLLSASKSSGCIVMSLATFAPSLSHYSGKAINFTSSFLEAENQDVMVWGLTLSVYPAEKHLMKVEMEITETGKLILSFMIAFEK